MPEDDDLKVRLSPGLTWALAGGLFLVQAAFVALPIALGATGASGMDTPDTNAPTVTP